MALDPRRQRIRNNLRRMWLLSAAAVAADTPAPEYDPNDLFEGGTYKGFWLDASTISTLFTDAAGTTPVVSDGDPVGYWADKATGQTAGSAWVRHTSDSYRPVYKEVGGYPCVRFDNSTDARIGLQANTAGDDWLPGTGGCTFVFIIDRLGTPAATNAGYCTFYGSDYLKGFTAEDWNSTTLRHSEQNLYTTATMANVNVFTARHVTDNTAPSYEWRLNKVLATSGGAGTTSVFAAGTPGHRKFGGDSGTGAPWFDLYQAFFINRRLNDTEVAELEVKLASLAGLTI